MVGFYVRTGLRSLSTVRNTYDRKRIGHIWPIILCKVFVWQWHWKIYQIWLNLMCKDLHRITGHLYPAVCVCSFLGVQNQLNKAPSSLFHCTCPEFDCPSSVLGTSISFPLTAVWGLKWDVYVPVTDNTSKNKTKQNKEKHTKKPMFPHLMAFHAQNVLCISTNSERCYLFSSSF